MIISHKYKFIFVRTQKTASSSIIKYLYDYLGPDDICIGIGDTQKEILSSKNLPATEEDFIYKNLNNHAGYDYISSNYPNEWKNYFKFTVERNSYEKAISYFYWINHINPSKTKKGSTDFFKKHLALCSDWKRYTNNSIIAVDKVIQFDNLHEEFKKITQIPYAGELKEVFIKSNVTPNKINVKDWINDQQLEIINSVFSNEISYFNYKL
jgi:hypothetical protein